MYSGIYDYACFRFWVQGSRSQPQSREVVGSQLATDPLVLKLSDIADLRELGSALAERAWGTRGSYRKGVSI